MSTQNAFIQNQLSAVTQNNLPKSNLLSNVGSSGNGGVSCTDLNTLQLALQQQQQNLQQQLQSFLLQQPGGAQASAVLLHAQVQQAVTQATNQLKILQSQRDAQQQQQELLASVCQVLPDTPKSIPRSSPLDQVLPKTPLMPSIRNKGERNIDALSNDTSLNPLKIGSNRAALKAAIMRNQNKPTVSDALSNLLPIPPPLSTSMSQSSPVPLTSCSPHEFSRKPILPSSSPPSPPLFTSLPSPLTSRPIPLSTSTSIATVTSNNTMIPNQTGFPRFPLIPQQQPVVPRLDLPADENVDLEELEQFAKEFKQRRIKLGKIR